MNSNTNRDVESWLESEEDLMKSSENKVHGQRRVSLDIASSVRPPDRPVAVAQSAAVPMTTARNSPSISPSFPTTNYSSFWCHYRHPNGVDPSQISTFWDSNI